MAAVSTDGPQPLRDMLSFSAAVFGLRLVVFGQCRHALIGRAHQPSPGVGDRLRQLLHLLHGLSGQCLKLLLQADLALLQLTAAGELFLRAQDVAAVLLISRARQITEARHGRAAGHGRGERANECRSA